jgi:hypothetical protein
MFTLCAGGHQRGTARHDTARHDTARHGTAPVVVRVPKARVSSHGSYGSLSYRRF